MLIVQGGLSDQMQHFNTFENKTKYIYGNVSAWKNLEMISLPNLASSFW